MVVEGLAALIRDYQEKDSGVDIWCRHALAELRSFIVTDSGRPEASAGRHDDDVLSLAIGLATIEGATAYSEPVVVRKYPKDLQSLMESRSGMVLSSYS
jgi:hypothetical protein